jgi:hypothetical protein
VREKEERGKIRGKRKIEEFKCKMTLKRAKKPYDKSV